MRIYNLLIAIIFSFGVLGMFGTVTSTLPTSTYAEETDTEETKAKDAEKDKDSDKQSEKDKEKDSNLIEFLL